MPRPPASSSEASLSQSVNDIWQAQKGFNSELYELKSRRTLQSATLAGAIATGAECTLEQFTYTAHGAHPDWRLTHGRLQALNNRLRHDSPIAFFVNDGYAVHFGYPAGYGFDQEIETVTASAQKLGRSSVINGDKQWQARLALPMRLLFDFDYHGGNVSIAPSEQPAIKSLFTSEVRVMYPTPHADVEILRDVTYPADPDIGDKCVLAIGWQEIYDFGAKSPDEDKITALQMMRERQDHTAEGGRFAD